MIQDPLGDDTGSSWGDAGYVKTHDLGIWLIIIEMTPDRCYGNASTRKRLNTEMPQKKAETPQKL